MPFHVSVEEMFGRLLLWKYSPGAMLAGRAFFSSTSAFVPAIVAEDGDAVDVLVLTDEPSPSRRALIKRRDFGGSSVLCPFRHRFPPSGTREDCLSIRRWTQTASRAAFALLRRDRNQRLPLRRFGRQS